MHGARNETRVAILVDCDNVPPDILEHALRFVAQFGRVVLRRGYGNSATLSHTWKEALVQLAFTPCLQFQYASGKNTSDLALALDALEVLFDGRADTFCIVTSDSDFAYLCRKLRERGATVCVVGEAKTPGALRNASDHFLEWAPAPSQDGACAVGPASESNGDARQSQGRNDAAGQRPQSPPVKRRPRFVVEAVTLLANGTAEGRVDLSTLGQYLKRTDPGFSPQTYGHAGLRKMVETYDLLTVHQEEGGHCSVGPAQKTNADSADGRTVE